MDFVVNLQLMSRYNQLMNQKILSAANHLNSAELKRDRGAFFGSILGSLNHIYVADVIWLRRFAQHPQQYQSLKQLPELSSYTNLRQQIAAELEMMSKIRQQLDEMIIAWCQELSTEDLAISLQYKNTQGQTYRRNFGQLVFHFFNHQTHHRGQISTLLSQQGLDLGVTDLLAIIPEQ